MIEHQSFIKACANATLQYDYNIKFYNHKIVTYIRD